MKQENSLTQELKAKARELGFDGIGISKAQEIPGFQKMLEQWLQSGYNGSMDYMRRNSEKRCDPTLLVEGARSVISLITSYYPEQTAPEEHPQVAKYAYGTDYHFVLKDRMQLLWDFLESRYPDLAGRMFVDSAPVADKLWAVQGGLGWLGKNSCLINRELGSFVFISELLVNVPLDYDEPYASNFCGGCTKCIDACPTKAIVQPGVIDATRCISYQTIENKTDSIPESIAANMQNRLFGCDICQDVCPWNKKAKITEIQEFAPHPEFFHLDAAAWQEMDGHRFGEIFKSSALKRAKLKGLQRNLRALNP